MNYVYVTTPAKPTSLVSLSHQGIKANVKVLEVEHDEIMMKVSKIVASLETWDI